MGERIQNQNIGIPGRHPNNWEVECGMRKKQGYVILQYERRNIESILSRNLKSCRGPTTGSPNAETTFGTQEKSIFINLDMKIDRDNDRVCQEEPFVLKRPISSLELPIISPRDRGA
ncbi:hypothetical protein AYI69_g3608 [Smittium culicis]|uniref:Uncharacterized protein n=1 Tax=Smittium culicis TaxID=133412 RepID=A0A1R1YJR7_9FUNG|nr:hypothetical protein AYI69_g3608 [Smittium culicis]